MNPRIAIRNAVYSILVAQPSLALVKIGRQHRISASRQLPAVCIYTDTDNQQRDTIGAVLYEHDLELKVMIYAKADGGDLGESMMDSLCDQLDASIGPALIGSVDIAWSDDAVWNDGDTWQDAQTIIDGLDDVVPESWSVDGDGSANADYLIGERVYRIAYRSGS